MKLRQILLGAAIAAMPVAAAAADCEIGMGIAPIMEGDQCRRLWPVSLKPS